MHLFFIKVVSLLLNYGADITLCNDRGQSILDFAPDSMRPLLLGMLLTSLLSKISGMKGTCST